MFSILFPAILSQTLTELFYFTPQRSSPHDAWKWVFPDIAPGKGVAFAGLSKLQYLVSMKNGINNQLEMEAPSSGVCRCCERNKLTFAADGTSAVVKNNWKLMCSWLLGSVPDRKEKVWIKDDCSLFAPSQAPVTWWKDRWFSLGLWRQGLHWLLF